jgi:hypothetical protein
LRSPLAGAEVLVDAASGRGDNYSMLDRRTTRGMTGCLCVALDATTCTLM